MLGSAEVIAFVTHNPPPRGGWFKDPDGNLISLTEPSKTAAPRATA